MSDAHNQAGGCAYSANHYPCPEARVVVSGDQLNLDALEARAGEAWRATPLSDDVLALVAEVRRLRAMIAPPCPECRQGKHDGCNGSTWDAVADEPAECPCAEAGHRA